MQGFFSKIEDFINGKVSLAIDKAGKPSAEDMQIGAVLLLVQAAQANGSVTNDEMNSIVKLLAKEFKLSDEGASEMIQVAKILSTNSSKADELINAVAAGFTVEQRQKIVSMVWKVITADGSTEMSEGTFAAEARKKLGLTLEQAVHAQKS